MKYIKGSLPVNYIVKDLSEKVDRGYQDDGTVLQISLGHI